MSGRKFPPPASTVVSRQVRRPAWGIGAVLLVLVLAINLAARLAKTKLKQKQ